MIELNTIYNEDCLETMKRMPDGFVDLVVTSPPYFNARDYSQYESTKHYRDEMRRIFQHCLRVLKPAQFCVVNISPVIIARLNRSSKSTRLPLPSYLVVDLLDIGFEFQDEIIWSKPDGAAKNRNAQFFQSRKPRAYKPNVTTESILVFQRPATFLVDKTLKAHSLVVGDYERTNVWRLNPETSSQHPAPYPEELAARIVRLYSYEDEIVYDPFMGSGTTAKACLNLRRSYIGSEISKEYCDIAESRLKQEVLL